jgi:hypothetical protein
MIAAARPLALYYSYMNLAKVFCLTRGARATFNQAKHGLSERLASGGQELADAYLVADPIPVNNAKAMNFGEFMRTLTGTGLAVQTRYDMPALLPQIVPGHRLWARAVRKSERFIALHDTQFWQDHEAHTLWLRLYLIRDDLSRLNVSHHRLLTESGLGSDFREVDCDETYQGRPLVCVEQIVATNYGGNHPADILQTLVNLVRSKLWATVSTVPPYRRYYVYLCPPNEVGFLLPQLLSIYAVTFYLGSITRYRPHHYDALAGSSFGPRIIDFVTGQPLQFLYLMASEFACQDVTKPSIL